MTGNADAVPIDGHEKGTQTCAIGECRFFKRRKGGPIGLLDSCNCGGVLHAVDANWDDYDFGTKKGYVYFDLCCDKCGATVKGYAA